MFEVQLLQASQLLLLGDLCGVQDGANHFLVVSQRGQMLGLSVPSSGPSFSPRPKMTLNTVVRAWVEHEP